MTPRVRLCGLALRTSARWRPIPVALPESVLESYRPFDDYRGWIGPPRPRWVNGTPVASPPDPTACGPSRGGPEITPPHLDLSPKASRGRTRLLRLGMRSAPREGRLDRLLTRAPAPGAGSTPPRSRRIGPLTACQHRQNVLRLFIGGRLRVLMHGVARFYAGRRADRQAIPLLMAARAGGGSLRNSR